MAQGQEALTDEACAVPKVEWTFKAESQAPGLGGEDQTPWALFLIYSNREGWLVNYIMKTQSDTPPPPAPLTGRGFWVTATGPQVHCLVGREAESPFVFQTEQGGSKD